MKSLLVNAALNAFYCGCGHKNGANADECERCALVWELRYSRQLNVELCRAIDEIGQQANPTASHMEDLKHA